MGLLSNLPVISSVGYIVNNLGKGIREQGLLGAAKVLVKGISQDWALGILALFTPLAGAAAVGLTAATVGDLVGVLDLPSEKKGNKDNQLQPPEFELAWGMG